MTHQEQIAQAIIELVNAERQAQWCRCQAYESNRLGEEERRKNYMDVARLWAEDAEKAQAKLARLGIPMNAEVLTAA